jgi:hypothetical protein
VVNTIGGAALVVGGLVVGAVTFDIANGKIATVRGIAAPTHLTVSPNPGGNTHRTRRSSPRGNASAFHRWSLVKQVITRRPTCADHVS